MRKKRSQQRASSYARSESDKEGEDGPTFLETLFGAGTDARDDTSDYYTSDASQSESSDSREDYPYLNQRRAQLSSFESEVSESGDDKSVEKFDRDLRARHTQACKYMRVSECCHHSYNVVVTHLASLPFSIFLCRCNRAESLQKPSKSLKTYWPPSWNDSAKHIIELGLPCTT